MASYQGETEGVTATANALANCHAQARVASIETFCNGHAPPPGTVDDCSARDVLADHRRKAAAIGRHQRRAKGQAFTPPPPNGDVAGSADLNGGQIEPSAANEDASRVPVLIKNELDASLADRDLFGELTASLLDISDQIAGSSQK